MITYVSMKVALFLSLEAEAKILSQASFTFEASGASHFSAKMFPRQFNWVMVALNSVSVLSNARSLKCVLNTFNTDVTLFRILSLDGIISLVFSFLSAITHGLSATGVLAEGKIKCSLMLMTTMPAYVNGILCSLMISVIR